MKKSLVVAIIIIAFCVLWIFSAPAEAQEESGRKSMVGFGLVADWRVKFFFTGGFYSGLNKNQYFWSVEDVRFETNIRNIPASETSISSHRFVGILLGKSF